MGCNHGLTCPVVGVRIVWFLMSILDEIKADVTGAAILKDWLGEGGEPVLSRRAECRSYICLYCPENKKGNWWDQLKTELANLIRAQLEIKNKLELRVPEEEHLGTCATCFCNLPLKVWCPIKHIAKHTKPETLARFPGACWQKNEIEHYHHERDTINQG